MNLKFYTSRTSGALLIALAGLLAPHAHAQDDAYLYSTDFNAKTLADLNFAAIDANSDGTTWLNPVAGTSRYLDGETLSSTLDIHKVEINSGNHNDWLISPGIRFEAGKTYKGTIIVTKPNYSATNEALELKLGTSKTSGDDFEIVLIPKDKFVIPQGTGGGRWTFNFEISVAVGGDYYIGLHAEGSPGQKVGVTDLMIENGIGMVTPVAPTELTVTPDATDYKKVTISMIAPENAKDGSTLQSIEKIEVKAGEKVAGTIDNPTPGQACSVEYTVAVNGVYTFTAQAFTADGGGDIASVAAFVGVNTPGAATDVVAVNTGNTSAKITWKAPEVDKDGYPVIPATLKYDITRAVRYGSAETVATDVTDLFFEDTLPADMGVDSQDFYTYSVTAKTAEGKASAVDAIFIPMGLPFEMPYTESFSKANPPFANVTLERTTKWSQDRSSSGIDDVTSIDGDNGLLYLDGYSGGGSAAYMSQLVDLSTSTSPTLAYYTYAIYNGDDTDNLLQVSVIATDGTTKDFEQYAPRSGWNKTLLELTEFAGKTIRFVFTGTRNNNTYLILDAIEIATIFDHDLHAAAIHVPAKVHSSEEFDITVDVLNKGSKVSEDYTVELYCDGTKVVEENGTALEVGGTHNVKFTRVHGITDPETATYSAKIVYEHDKNIENNETEAVTTQIQKNSYPTVTDLDGEKTGNSIKLNWSEPDTDKAQPYDLTDNFESYDSWATSNVGGWIFVDKDEAQIAGFNNGEATIEMPGVPSYSKQSWWVFDNTTAGFNNGSFATTSGNKFLMAMVSGIQEQGFVQNDDWAISPELYGGPQTISFQAKSYTGTELESIEVLYSTGSTDTDEFNSIKKIDAVPFEFTEYTVDLPDGAKRFAIRYVSDGKMAIMIDDVNYIPVGDPAAFAITGYNIYRNGEKINDEPVEECEYEDTTAPEGEHKYNVTVLYSSGESQFSNDWLSTLTVIDTVVVSTPDEPIEFYNLQGIKVVEPQHGKIYIMRQGNASQKVLVK